ncbi:MAG: glycosyltransferase family 4 protein [Myxococcota bacterium]|nr:glycosyltransferase family 4 protein [Myxococcota bacterium]
MRWTLVTEDFPPNFIGGIATWVYELASALHEQGESVCVFARKTKNCHTFDAQAPFPIYRMYGRSWAKYKSLWVKLALLRHKTEILLFANWELATKITPSTNGNRMWVAAHGSDITRPGIHLPSLKSMVPKVEYWLPVSQYLKGILHRYIGQQSYVVIPMPIPIAPSPTVFRADKPLLLIARKTPFKGIDASLSLAQQLKRPLWIIGHNGSDTGWVRYLGTLSLRDTRKTISQSAAVLLLSQTDSKGFFGEGLGLSLLEAAAEGVIGIGSQTGGIPEAIGPGLVIDPSKPNLDEIESALCDPTRGVAAWKWIQKNHGKERAVSALRKLR